MDKIKENTKQEFVKMIAQSWTYEKMTAHEKTYWILLVNDVKTENAIKGTFDQRWDILNAIYYAYLIGIGYDGHNWRSPDGQSF